MILTVAAPHGPRSQGFSLKRTVTVDAVRDLTDVTIDLRGAPNGGSTSTSLVDFKGVVRYPDGKPAVNAQVMLTPEIEPDPYRRTNNGDVGGRKYTSKDGSFQFDGIKSTAQWTIWVLDSTKEMGASQVLSTPEQLKAPIQLTLQQGAGVFGNGGRSEWQTDSKIPCVALGCAPLPIGRRDAPSARASDCRRAGPLSADRLCAAGRRERIHSGSGASSIRLPIPASVGQSRPRTTVTSISCPARRRTAMTSK